MQEPSEPGAAVDGRRARWVEWTWRRDCAEPSLYNCALVNGGTSSNNI